MKLLPFLATLLIAFSPFLSGEEIMKFNTLSASFTQTVTDKTVHTYQGTLTIQKPFKAVWRYTKPIAREIYIDKGSVTTYEPRLAQATVNSVDKSINVVGLLKMASKVKDGLYRTSYDKKDIFITTEDGILETIKYTDPLGGNITIKFNNVILNGTIKDTMSFIPPKGTTILQGQ
jgi:outer membrane lipoprotein carrier protein